MAVIFQNSNLTSAVANTLQLAAGDVLAVAADIEISNTGGFRAISTDAQANIHLQGTAFGIQGIQIVGAAGTTSEVVIAATGNCIGTADGVVLEGAGTLNIRNYGAITGLNESGIQIFGSSREGGSVINHGNISGQDQGVRIDSGTGDFVLMNFGTISATAGDSYRSTASNVSDRITNDGVMIGNIQLGTGADIYNGQGGRVVGTVFGEDGADTLTGGSFDESMDGGAGQDRLVGRGGDDTLVGGLDNDSLFGGDNNDSLVGGGSNDYLDGQGEDDEVYGGDNNDTLFGNHGNDYLDGQGENDLIDGGFGNDIIRGNIGQDQMVGGAGSDTMTGGVGDDQFRFFASDLENGRRDVITDFAEAGGNADLLVFFDGIQASNITTSQAGGDVIVRITYAGGTAVHEIVVENFLVAQLADQIFFL